MVHNQGRESSITMKHTLCTQYCMCVLLAAPHHTFTDPKQPYKSTDLQTAAVQIIKQPARLGAGISWSVNPLVPL